MDWMILIGACILLAMSAFVIGWAVANTLRRK